MTAETKPPTPPSRFEVWQLLSILAGGMFVFLMWTTYRLPPALAALLFLGVATAAYGRSLPFVALFVAAFVPMEVQFTWRSPPYAWATMAALCVYVAVHCRSTAAAFRWPTIARPSRTLWQILTMPLRRLFGGKSQPVDSTPATADEAFGFLASLASAAALAFAWWNFAPIERFIGLGLNIDRGWPIAAALAAAAAVAVLTIRGVLHVTDPDRRDPQLAELELNEILWNELRNDLDLIGERLGSAGVRDPRISELFGPESKPRR